MSRLALSQRRAIAITWSLAAASLLFVFFLRTPFTTIPYETTWLSLPDLVRHYSAAFSSNNFTFDQDRMSWKFYFGTFGWHDTFYPDYVYALARWGCVALLVLLPLLSLDFAGRRPGTSLALLVVSGSGFALCLASLLIRHSIKIHPYGRFILPLLPLALLPMLLRLESPGRTRVFADLVRIGVLFHIWTAISVIGRRYLFAL